MLAQFVVACALRVLYMWLLPCENPFFTRRCAFFQLHFDLFLTRLRRSCSAGNWFLVCSRAADLATLLLCPLGPYNEWGPEDVMVICITGEATTDIT